jgi:hypothetical protein
MVRTKAWLGLAAIALAAGAALAIGSEPAFAQSSVQPPAAPELATPAPSTVPKPVLKTVPKPIVLAPDVAFARFIALIRGHLLTGDAMVKQGEWSAAHPHFMFPIEEIYGIIRYQLHGYATPPFDAALKALARTVAAHNARLYPKAWEKVQDALAAADASLKARQANWPRFVLDVSITVLNAAADEYEDAVVNDRIVRPVGYETARGFILEADRMVESVAPELDERNGAALAGVRAGLAELKTCFSAVNAPHKPVMDVATLHSVTGKIELAAAAIK